MSSSTCLTFDMFARVLLEHYKARLATNGPEVMTISLYLRRLSALEKMVFKLAIGLSKLASCHWHASLLVIGRSVGRQIQYVDLLVESHDFVAS